MSQEIARDALREFFPHLPQGAPFPLDVDAPTLFQARGQLARASVVWMAKHLRFLSDAGADGARLAALCALASQAPLPPSGQLLLWVASLDSSALDACLIPSLATPALADLAEEFARAATQWTPPQDPLLRGWSKTFTDEDIQAQSREKFAHLSQQCRQWASQGLPQALEELALRCDRDEFKARAAPKAALGMLLSASLERPHLRLGFFGPRSPKLRAQMASIMAPKKFRTAMEALAQAEGQDATLAASSMGRAMRGAPPDRRMAQLEYCAHHAPAGAPLRALFEAFLDCSLDDPTACSNAFLAMAQDALRRSASVARCGLGLAQALRDHGAPLAPCAQLTALMWTAHLNSFPTPPLKERRAKLFASQHLALNAMFPHPQFCAASLSRATPAAAAQIEASDIEASLAFGPGAAWDAPDGEDPPARKMRL